MYTFALLTLLEIYLAILPVDMPGQLTAGLLILLAMCIMPASIYDTRRGFAPAVGFAVSMGWYLASIPRYLPHFDRVYLQCSDEVGLILAFMLLVVTPFTLLAAPLLPYAGLPLEWYRNRE